MCIGTKRNLLRLVALGLLLVGCRPNAAELWTEHCIQCHGEDGRGVEPQLTFYPQVDLTRSELIADDARGALYKRIAFGWGTMPGFDHKLQQSDLEKLVDYSIELGQGNRATAAGATP
jgi:mono/diheme cytochrome c family protein